MSVLSQSVKLNLNKMQTIEQSYADSSEPETIDGTTDDFCALYNMFLKWVKDTGAKTPSNSDDGEYMARWFRSFVRDTNKELFDRVDYHGLSVYETVLVKWDVECDD